ncbi:MAG TPA: pilus assembly protein PilM [Phycisphaerae bacterium]|nr:pilus assembly protein PilM [Phycisphaerae bacterium]HOJ74230.1 pilus assembly protein PilM [Phycisphaerae bacterium]HOM51309.1 pilus assembly protein PilM [Phycisphaerae bacterium]HON65117.1 pilus assembly protein PilM [Phycisphaerae bacterium]HOQ86172.1 pilus assembly protein PilM [Phycisphaerae bacterium]
MFRSVKQHSPIAVDLGTASLHVVQLDRQGGKLALQRWCELPVKPAPGGDPPAGDGAAAMPRWPAIDRTRFQGNEVVVSLAPPDIECAPLRVPENLLQFEHDQLLAAIQHEVGRHISHPVESVEMDVWRLVPGHLDAPNLMVAAARREVILGVLAWLNEQGLTCRRIDVGPLAAMRACSRLTNRPAPEQLWGVLDVGKAAVRLYIGIDEVPVYVRCIPKGGDEMTRRISEELGVEFGIAESYKRHYGIHGTDGHYRSGLPISDAVDSRRMAGILLGALRPTIRSLAEEIQRSFRYAMGLYPDRPIAGLWVIGGGADLAGFPDVLGDMLGVVIHKVTPDLLPGDWVVPSGRWESAVSRVVNSLGACLGEMN